MHDTGQSRFFVTVSARGADDLRRLQVHGMDLFAATARRKKGHMARPFAIEGLLDQAEIVRLQAAGYEVNVDAPIGERSVKPDDTLEFDAWLARMRALAAKDGAVK
ncbi:hypothetical protein ACSFA8_24760 [Variovorax sp. RT4R15]|uniref:hypothetical protein n=1 Tax=Variovorax sp. RT4R15 TaxID=3443737 RepID=UPI003F481BAA